jgi:hypothetical protein
MQLPWTTRKYLDLAIARALHAEANSLLAEQRLSDYIEQSARRSNIEESERKALADENKLLIDRIVQMSGQPPIFHPAPITTPQPPPEPSSLPAPETRVSFADVHRETRQAIKEGKLNLMMGDK